MDPEEIRKYLLRSYTAVDGLWFMKVEDKLGFEAALELDAEVWSVMPKIQARQLKSALSLEGGIEALKRCYTEKLALEEFDFQVRDLRSGFAVHVARCPWYDKLVRAKRAHLAERIGNRICTTEYSAWAAEFGCRFRFEGTNRICGGGESCVLVFEPEKGG